MTDEKSITKRYDRASNWAAGIIGAGMLACAAVGITNVSKFMFKERSPELKQYYANLAESSKIVGLVYEAHNLVYSISQLETRTNSQFLTKANLEAAVAKAKEVETYFTQRQAQLKSEISSFEKTPAYKEHIQEENQVMRTFNYSMGGTTLLFLLGLAVPGAILVNKKRKLAELQQSSTKTA
jgi:hypothetical protein